MLIEWRGPQARNPHHLGERGLSREGARAEGLVDHRDKPARADVGLFEPTAGTQVDVRSVEVGAVDLMNVHGPGIQHARTWDFNGQRPTTKRVEAGVNADGTDPRQPRDPVEGFADKSGSALGSG